MKYFNKAVELTQEEKEIIFGGLLGDMSLQLKGTLKSPRGKIEHGYKQEEYVKYKHKLLNNIALPIRKYTKYDKRFKNPNYTCYYFGIKTNPNLFEFYNTFYPESKKRIPEELELLSPLAIAIWFMDDGSKEGKSVKISTQSFIKEDLLRLTNHLQIKYNLEFIIRKDNSLYLRLNSFERFKELILKNIPKSMRYKLEEI